MNPTVETIAHRRRIGPPRWGFGSFWGPVPRPMAWADIGLSRCDVGAPVNDIRPGVGSGTHFHAIVDGRRYRHPMMSPHDHMRTTLPRVTSTPEQNQRTTTTSSNDAPVRGPHRTTVGVNSASIPGQKPRRTNIDKRQTPTNANNHPERPTTHHQHERCPKIPKPRMGWSDVSPGHRPGFATPPHKT